jgi:hypothetical protein
MDLDLSNTNKEDLIEEADVCATSDDESLIEERCTAVKDPFRIAKTVYSAHEECKHNGENNAQVSPFTNNKKIDVKKEPHDKTYESGNGMVNYPAVKFAEEIKIDFIVSVDLRIMCRFLEVTTVNDIKSHPFNDSPLITFILMEALPRYMESKGYSFAGELNFDIHGTPIPVKKNSWVIRGKETSFTMNGFLYFESPTGVKKDNVVFYLFSNIDRNGGAIITCHTTDFTYSKKIIEELKRYSKISNCLRGSKLKDISISFASFSEVTLDPKYTWNNYYYPQNIIDLFDLEVFGFVKNIEKYNKRGITKRGVIMYGKPGTGKTTIGNIICNMLPNHTVIWITPEIMSEDNYRFFQSIKSLYRLADYVTPCVLLLEDLDLFGHERDKGGDLISVGALMNILDGVNTIKNSVTIGTTNRISSVETALRNRPGRFDRVIEIPTLDDTLRNKMFKNRLKGWKLSKEALDYLVKNTEEWTGAECQEFINSLNLKQIGSKRKSKILDKIWISEIIETMKNFGVGGKSGTFGFGNGQLPTAKACGLEQ